MKYELEMLKIIIIIIGYTLWIISLLMWQYHNKSWKIQSFQILEWTNFLKKIIIHFVNVETDPRLQ
jgi:hypothetical protein